MDAVLRDFRYAARGFVRARWLALTTIVTIGIGAGANATVFSFIDALLFRPPPGVAEPGSLVAVYTSDFSSGPYGTTSAPDYVSLLTDTTAFSNLAAYADNPGAIVSIGNATERVGTSAVTANYFAVLGARPALGRFFDAADGAGGGAPAAVIGHALWTRAFGADPSAAGAALTLDGRAYAVIGVAPEGFDGLDLARAREIWTLLPPPVDPAARGNRGLAVVGRLEPGTTIESAQAQLDALAERLAHAYPATNLGTLRRPDRPRPFLVARFTRIGPEFRSEVAGISAVMMTASLLVLLIASANVGSLLLARATARRREMAIRLAVGASGRQVVRHLAIESVLLGVAGGVAGLLVALWTADALPSFFPAEQVRLLDARIDGRVLAFCLAVSALASLVFGLAPVSHLLRLPAAAALRDEGPALTDSRGGRRLRRGFVVLQVALAFVLLAGAGLLVKSLRNALEADLGFGTRQAAIVSIDVPPGFGALRGLAHYADALARVRALPGVDRVAVSSVAPLTRGSRRGFRIDGYAFREGEDREQFVNAVSPEYFAAMRIPLVEGRVFDERDDERSARVAIVNDEFARRYFTGSALGRRIVDSRSTALEIVGVVRASAVLSPRSPRLPVVYYPLAQSYLPSVRLIASTTMEPSDVLPALVGELRRLNPAVAVYRPTTMEGQIDEALAAERLTASLVTACGLLALALATVGVYGMVAYTVASRTRELAVRVALGASARDVSAIVLKEGLGLTLAGALAGGLVSVLATRALGSMLYRVSPTDPATLVAVPLLLCAIAALATWIPLRRAIRVNPVGILRQE
jgi:predicted permease